MKYFQLLFSMCALTLCSFLFCETKQYSQPFAPYFSQNGQDKYLNEQIFHNKRNGVFIDIGAHDGISFSNSYYFEKELGWTGICIEPMAEIFKELVRNRKAICLQTCISNYDGKGQFLKINGYSEMLSGLKKNYDPRHLVRIERELNYYGGSKELIEVNVSTLKTILHTYNIKKIDFVSIDTEGSELDILKSINLEEIEIDIIVVENAYNDSIISHYLLGQGYTLLNHIGADLIFKK